MSLRERFYRFVEKSPDPDGCWIWTGEVDRDGYGLLVVMDPATKSGKRWLKAHRLAWKFAHGREASKHVCHHCDNPGCVQPKHLFNGDDKANNRDMTLKGRNVFQRRNPSRKLSCLEVFGLKLGRMCGAPLKDLSERYGVAQSTVSRIANGVRRVGHSWLR